MYKFKNIFFMFATLILIFSTISFSYDDSSSYAWSSTYITKEVSSPDVLETNSNIENNNSLNLESGSAILIEQSTGQILYSHNIHEQLRPASVTKVMSILLIMEQIDNGYLSYSDTVSYTSIPG